MCMNVNILKLISMHEFVCEYIMHACVGILWMHSCMYYSKHVCVHGVCLYAWLWIGMSVIMHVCVCVYSVHNYIYFIFI